ncbi:MAG: hypothetical protein SFU86_25595 [Pirellulaceae bacterium]|nr:hypothetical protein [Pirellulaceae bacterium]
MIQKFSQIAHQRWAMLVPTLLFAIALAPIAAGQDLPPNTDVSAAPEVPTPLDFGGDDVEPLTRGPVHEAFAAPHAGDPAPSPVVPKQPPAEIDEEPPAEQPAGSIWIPGYWQWDDELKDFIWISGNWRVPPPNMRWVPPYWTEVAGGWQRIAGFWISADAGELEYRPTPPTSLEVGPSTPAPADNYFYTPGNWTYSDTGYRWQTGYWSAYQTDWVWISARWCWTPSGCIFCPGFWDFRLPFRGQLFAPVYFRRPIYAQPGYCYRPACVVDSSRLFVHLWIRPSCNSYYFGNYYGSNYASWNLTPWCNWQARRGCHDPLLTWCNTHYRQQGIDYCGRVQGWHNHFVAHAHDRPPRTFHEQHRLIASQKLDPRTSQNVLARRVGDHDDHDHSPLRLVKLDGNAQAAARAAAADIRKLHGERAKLEHAHRDDRDFARADKPHRPESVERNAGDKPLVLSGPKIDGPKLAGLKPTGPKLDDSRPGGPSLGGQPTDKPAKLQLPKLSESVKQLTKHPSGPGSKSGGDRPAPSSRPTPSIFSGRGPVLGGAAKPATIVDGSPSISLPKQPELGPRREPFKAPSDLVKSRDSDQPQSTPRTDDREPSDRSRPNFGALKIPALGGNQPTSGGDKPPRSESSRGLGVVRGDSPPKITIQPPTSLGSPSEPNPKPTQPKPTQPESRSPFRVDPRLARPESSSRGGDDKPSSSNKPSADNKPSFSRSDFSARGGNSPASSRGDAPRVSIPGPSIKSSSSIKSNPPSIPSIERRPEPKYSVPSQPRVSSGNRNAFSGGERGSAGGGGSRSNSGGSSERRSGKK